jgi:tetratricopeptide (TPR) repeat protein
VLLRQALREDPQNAAAHKDLGDVLLKEDLIDAARQEYAAARVADPSYDAALFGLAETHRAQGSYAQADSLLTELLSRHPQHPLYLNQLGAVKMLLGELTKARLLLNRALEIEPSYETALGNLNSLEQMERRANALAFPEEVTNQSEGELVNLGVQAVQALQRQDIAAADSLTRLSLERFPSSPLALYFRGAFLLRTNQPQAAAELLVQVVRAAPGRAITTGAAVIALGLANRGTEARALAVESLAKAADDVNRAQIAQMVARIDSAQAAR